MKALKISTIFAAFILLSYFGWTQSQHKEMLLPDRIWPRKLIAYRYIYPVFDSVSAKKRYRAVVDSTLRIFEFDYEKAIISIDGVVTKYDSCSTHNSYPAAPLGDSERVFWYGGHTDSFRYFYLDSRVSFKGGFAATVACHCKLNGARYFFRKPED